MHSTIRNLLIGAALTSASCIALAQTAGGNAASSTVPSANNLLQAAQNLANNSQAPATTTTVPTSTAATTSTAPTTATQAKTTASSGAQCTNKGFIFQNKQLLLNNDVSNAQRIFVIVNSVGNTVMINHTTPTNPGSGNTWGAKLDGGQAGLIAMGQPNFTLGCMSYNPPQFSIVDCQSVIRVCALQPLHGIGSYWIAQNIPTNKIGETLQQRNIAVK